MNRVWKKLYPRFLHDFQGFEFGEVMKELQQQCVALAKEVGFHEVEKADAVELELHKEELSHELNELH
jgi:hypothetical protein